MLMGSMTLLRFRCSSLRLNKAMTWSSATGCRMSRRDIRHPVADDHVIALFSRSDEQRNLNRVMLPISIDGYRAIITTIHEIPESCLERSALAHIELVAKDNGSCGFRSPSRIVGRTVVDDHRGGHKWTHPFHDSRDVVFFIERRNDRSDSHGTVLQKSKKFRNCVGSWSTIASYCCAKSTTKARTQDRSSEVSGLIDRPNSAETGHLAVVQEIQEFQRASCEKKAVLPHGESGQDAQRTLLPRHRSHNLCRRR